MIMDSKVFLGLSRFRSHWYCIDLSHHLCLSDCLSVVVYFIRAAIYEIVICEIYTSNIGIFIKQKRRLNYPKCSIGKYTLLLSVIVCQKYV